MHILFLMYEELKAWKHMLVLPQKLLRTKMLNYVPIWKEKEALFIYAWLRHSSCYLGISQNKSDISRNRFVFGVFLNSCCNIFLRGGTGCDSKHCCLYSQEGWMPVGNSRHSFKCVEGGLWLHGIHYVLLQVWKKDSQLPECG